MLRLSLPGTLGVLAPAVLAILLLGPAHCFGQVGLGDVLGAQAAGQELEGQNARRAANAAADQGAIDAPEAPDAPENPESTDAPVPVSGNRPAASGPTYTDSDGLQRGRAEGLQDKWGDSHAMYRDTRPFVSWLKLLPVLLLYLIWIRTCDWVNRASQIHKLGYALWNGIVVGCGLIGLLVVILLPIYAAGISVYALLVLGPFIAFAIAHNRSVQQHQKVFTKDWWQYTMATLANKFGAKIDVEKKADYEKGPPVDLIAKGGIDDRANQANLMTARLSPGYVLVKELIADMTKRRSDRVLLDYGQEAVGVRHYIDGVWDVGEPRDRESGDVMLAVMKQLADMDVKERVKKQSGKFAAKYNGADFTCPIISQGVKTGERVMVSLQSSNSKPLNSFAELGMRDKLSQPWADALQQSEGLLLVSAMPEGGLTTLVDVSLLETDRLMRDVFSIEEKSDPQREIENIAPHFYDTAAGESPATLMPKLIRKYPDFYIVRDFENPESAKELIEQANSGKLVLTTTRAKDAPEAMLRVLQKKAPHKEFCQAISAVLNTRLIRVLCPECKVGYEPAPALLQKLKIPAAKAERLYRPPTAEEQNKPCPKCSGSGYFGRTGLFELLIVDDQVREVLRKQPKLENVRKAARDAGMRTLQEEGILLIVKGTTSLNELQRVLKQ
ncbi:ATPase, T2SS/T4P/T4SS family [Posidoniimonas polymericola]|uniref:ATPase, T2SS/T4P/T4SS family n=1 Tax=Posidoniimonas polymericola TaxID=2528002 RepID=UPI0011B4BB85|nr:ATPase, T2SS/T4P/T4SS family [Posidoniimonas polymericola]